MKPEELKVLIITNEYPDPSRDNFSSQFVADQVDFLSKYMANVTVVCPVSLFPVKPFRRSFVHGNVSVIFKYFVPSYLKHIKVVLKHFFPSNGDDAQMAQWVEHISTEYARLIAKMARRKDFDFDVIHAHFTMPSGGAAVILKREFRQPVVLTLHENQAWFLRLVKEENPGRIRVWTESDLVIRVNEEDMDLIKRYNQNVQYLPNGYNSNHYFVDSNFPREKNSIFAFGALIERKGYQDLVRSVAALRKDIPDIKCRIAGKDGGYGHELKALITSMGLEENVILMGPIPPAKAREMMNSCAVFCLPSISESFGVVQIEAMACGAPVVATINGASERIIEEGCGIVVARDQLDVALRTALTAKEWDHGYIRDVAKKFDMDVIAQRLRDAYFALYNKSRG